MGGSMSIVLAGSTSGTITLQEPAVAGTNTISLPASTGTVVLDSATQTLTAKTLTSPTITGAVVSSMASSVITRATAVASTSGTNIDFTGIPSWVRRITITYTGVSTNGANRVIVQLGTVSGFETSSYLGSASALSNAVTTTTNSTGFLVDDVTSANDVRHGSSVLTNPTENTWVFASVDALSNAPVTSTAAGSKALGGVLTQVRITTVGGTNTFDAGSINIFFE
jgi:hypothetical protein